MSNADQISLATFTEYRKLPIVRWEVQYCSSKKCKKTHPVIGYAKDYSRMDLRLWWRERRGTTIALTSAALFATATAVTAPLFGAWCLLPMVLGILALVIAPPQLHDERKQNPNVRAARPVVVWHGVKGQGSWQSRKDALAAARKDQETTLKALEVLAKMDDDTTPEAKLLAVEVIRNLAEAHRADEELRAQQKALEAARREAEAEALREFEALVPKVVDRSDEMAMGQVLDDLKAAQAATPNLI